MIFIRMGVFYFAIVALEAQQTLAQPPVVFGPPTRTRLVSFKEVQVELKMTEEQKEIAAGALATLNARLGELSKDIRSGGDIPFEVLRDRNTKLNDEADATITKKLDDSQKKRLLEIFVQKNETMDALTDSEVQKQLGLSEETKATIAKARTSGREAIMAARSGPGATFEAMQKIRDSVIQATNEKVIAAITPEQKATFDKMGGKILQVDLSSLRPQTRARGF